MLKDVPSSLPGTVHHIYGSGNANPWSLSGHKMTLRYQPLNDNFAMSVLVPNINLHIGADLLHNLFSFCLVKLRK